MGKQNRYPAEVRERAVRLVYETQDEHGSEWAAICWEAGMQTRHRSSVGQAGGERSRPSCRVDHR